MRRSEVFRDEHADYASNVFPRTYPRGLDTEVFTVAALDRAWSEAREPHQREHVTPYLYEHPRIFRQASLSGDCGLQPLSLDPGYAGGPGTAACDLLPLRRPRRFLLAGGHSPDGARARTGRAQFARFSRNRFASIDAAAALSSFAPMPALPWVRATSCAAWRWRKPGRTRVESASSPWRRRTAAAEERIRREKFEVVILARRPALRRMRRK